MYINKKPLVLALGLVIFFPIVTSADQVILDDVIVGAENAPKFDCTAATLPFFDSDWKVDPTASIGTFAPGEIITIPTPDLPTCNFSSGPPYMCEFTCEVLSSLFTCVGYDCVNNESFTGSTMKLKENNLRIRFHDTSAANALGQSWNLETNSTQNGGSSYFGFQVKSVEKDRVMYSDGTAWPLYDCNATLIDSSVMPTPIFDQACLQTTPPPPSDCLNRSNLALIPAGEPIIESKQTCELVNQQTVCSWACVESLDYTVKSVLTFGSIGIGQAPYYPGVAIGYESTTEDDSISVGRNNLKRRIAHVAKGLAVKDLLTKEGLELDSSSIDRQTLLADRIALADTLLDGIEISIAFLESGPPNDPNDIDGDGIANNIDNCISTLNPNQLDADNNNIGNACDEGDADGDGISDKRETQCGSDPNDRNSQCGRLTWLMLLLGD